MNKGEALFVVQNKTPYPADAVLLPNANGEMTVVTVIKATFSFSTDGKVKAAENQMPLCYGDEYWGKPGLSSLRYATDMVFGKKGTDIALNGHAYAPMRNPEKKIQAALAVGSLQKILTVTGDRFKSSKMGITSRPQPFVKIPLRYERTFGGMDTSHQNNKKHNHFRENPVGIGFGPWNGPENCPAFPNIEHAETSKKTKKKPKGPAGFGFIAPSWEPRLSYAGTFDDVWRKERMPFPPLDFDIRFNNAASHDLVMAEPIKGHEKVTLVNLHPSAETVRFTLPGLVALKTAYIFEHETKKPQAFADTLIIEPDENRFMMVFRTTYQGPIPWPRLIQVTIQDDTENAPD